MPLADEERDETLALAIWLRQYSEQRSARAFGFEVLYHEHDPDADDEREEIIFTSHQNFATHAEAAEGGTRALHALKEWSTANAVGIIEDGERVDVMGE